MKEGTQGNHHQNHTEVDSLTPEQHQAVVAGALLYIEGMGKLGEARKAHQERWPNVAFSESAYLQTEDNTKIEINQGQDTKGTPYDGAQMHIIIIGPYQQRQTDAIRVHTSYYLFNSHKNLPYFATDEWKYTASSPNDPEVVSKELGHATSEELKRLLNTLKDSKPQ